MAQIPITERGLVLAGSPGSDDANGPSAGTKPQQAMRLDLEDGVLDEILKASRTSGKGVQMSFGKTVVCPAEESPSTFSIAANVLT